MPPPFSEISREPGKYMVASRKFKYNNLISVNIRNTICDIRNISLNINNILRKALVIEHQEKLHSAQHVLFASNFNYLEFRWQ